MEIGTESRDSVARRDAVGGRNLARAVLGALKPRNAVRPLAQRTAEPAGGADLLPVLRRAVRQRRDVRLDASVLTLLMQCLARIDSLERQVRSLRAHLPAQPPAAPREGPRPWREPHG